MWRVGSWLGIYLLVFLWSAWEPKDRLTWWLEVAPALLALCALALTYRRFRFTPLAYTLILIHCVILMVGGHYTYAEVPLFDWLSEVFGWTRNNYDKVGHLAQGFVPAIVAREILIRTDAVRRGAWLVTFVLCFVLALSAAYELLEWAGALILGSGADAFLGMQGYVWDTQTDMFMALLGGIAALLSLTRLHDRQMW